MKTITALFVVCALALSGCAVTQHNPVKACQYQPVCSAYGLYAVAKFSTANALQSGLITVERAQEIRAKLNSVRPTLDAARIAFKNGNKSAYQKLAAAQAVIRAIMRQLPHQAIGSGQ